MTYDLILPSRENISGVRRLLVSLSLTDLTGLKKVFVVLNPPNQKIADQIRSEFTKLSGLEILQSDHVGVNTARNLGAEKSHSEVLFFLDDDEAINDPAFFKKHIKIHSENPALMVLGGVYELVYPTGLWSQAYHQIQMKWLISGEALDASNHHLLGGHLSVKRQIFENFKFDNAIRFGGAETEFLLRLKRANILCQLDLSLSVLHFHNLSISSFLRKAFMQGSTHRKYSFQELNNLKRRILPNYRSDLPQNKAQLFAQKLYFLAFNIGRNSIETPRAPKWSISALKIYLQRQILWFILKIDFLAKKAEKSRPPDT